MTRKPLTDADILAQIPAARARAERERKAGLYARSARYDKHNHRILLELTNGYLLGIPVSTLPPLASATPKQLSEVETSGMDLTFPALDADYSVPALVLSWMNARQATRELARVAGRVRSPAKARAARANGAKGGRPRRSSL